VRATPTRLVRPLLVLKTNLMADVGITPQAERRRYMPNLELEYLFDRRFSVALAGLYDRFGGVGEYRKWHVTAYTLEPRYRFVRSRAGDLYAGIYGRTGDYNFLLRTGTTHHTGNYLEGGISLGYSLPIARHWVVEAGVAGGYRRVSAKDYLAGNILDKRSILHKIDLTDLFLRIGYRFGKTSPGTSTHQTVRQNAPGTSTHQTVRQNDHTK
jgi:hypothetical protein